MNSSENETEHNKTTSNINELIFSFQNRNYPFIMTLRKDNLVRYLIGTDGSIASHGSKRQEWPGNGRPMSNCLTILYT